MKGRKICGKKTKKDQTNKKTGTKVTARVGNPVNTLKNMATENKAVINGEMVQVYSSIFQSRFNMSIIYSLRDTVSDADCSSPLRILKIVTVGLKN